MKKNNKFTSVILAVILAASALCAAPFSADAADYKTTFINTLMNNRSKWYYSSYGYTGVDGEIMFTDLNFDGKPELIMQYAGGTMRNCDADAFYLSGSTLQKATSTDNMTAVMGTFTNFLTAYYDTSTNKYRMLGTIYRRNGAAYSWSGEFELNFNGKSISSKMISSYSVEDPKYTGNPTYTYYNGSNQKVSKTTHDSILKNYKKNLVNVDLKRVRISCRDWDNYTTAQKREALERAYDGFSYTKKTPSPTSVKLNRSTLGLGVGENYGLLKTVSPSNANQSVSWTSSNSSVATVSSSGNVVGKKAGTATVTVKTSNGKTASCKVTVKAAPSSIKINPASFKLGVGEAYTVSESTNSNSYANAANLRWSSSDTSVATVTKTAGTNKAVVTAKKAGTVTINIKTYNGKTASCKLTVCPAPLSVKLSNTSLTLNKGQSYTISESSPAGSYANAANLKWTSSNTKVATLTKGSGNKATVKAVSKGTATVKITLFNGKTATCKVTVK